MGKGSAQRRLPAVAPARRPATTPAERAKWAKRAVQRLECGPPDLAQVDRYAVGVSDENGAVTARFFGDLIEAAEFYLGAARTTDMLSGITDLERTPGPVWSPTLLTETRYMVPLTGCVEPEDARRVYRERTFELAQRYGIKRSEVPIGADTAPRRFVGIERWPYGLEISPEHSLHEFERLLGAQAQRNYGLVGIWDLGPLAGPVEIPIVFYIRMPLDRRRTVLVQERTQ